MKNKIYIDKKVSNKNVVVISGDFPGGEMRKEVNMDKLNKLKTKHELIIKFFMDRNGVVEWIDPDIDTRISKLINNAIPDVVSSYSDTECYMLNPDFIDNEGSEG
jgi:hypothetical protein